MQMRNNLGGFLLFCLFVLFYFVLFIFVYLIWFDSIWFDLIWFDLIWFDLIIIICFCQHGVDSMCMFLTKYFYLTLGNILSKEMLRLVESVGYVITPKVNMFKGRQLNQREVNR